MTILVVSVSRSKLGECVHAAFTSVEKHYLVLFFAGLQFVFKKYRMQKRYATSSLRVAVPSPPGKTGRRERLRKADMNHVM